ncbi:MULTISPECIES: hypothetical protein [unclassified Mesorhizobium]|uniref:hypothetical protein n=1 Tax=unclassified Mesorhizobium TaxID=325217 RepID=UPI000FCAFC5A|nr:MULTISPECIES: hypothetical protein [unclassified Mesorhizobium]RUV39963.1 hypothetical protein EOD29_30385 [Mesorhizobium sp. M1A.T.Ca.IN.004.03.1.1]RWK26729.1 MAG: hypothetical protein EOR40_30210 [Mesorhizobium sp.]RWK83956.1 MAG: hypothetical protein EOR52_29445 [Mesorhizobium sp.]TIP15280.1 MAG: hypothetical protein E5X66_30680 [Mesorhizobium sp.]TJW03894.1 MAG: hypothetical protein E5X42_30345 [Mesorhizobium sp.]
MSDKPHYLSASANKMKSSQKAEPALHRQHDGWTLQELMTQACPSRAAASTAIVIRSSICGTFATASAPMLRRWGLAAQDDMRRLRLQRITLTYSPDTRPKDLNRKRV